MAIRKTDDGSYVVSSNQCWRPGVFADERAARYSFRFSDEEVEAIQHHKNATDDSPITFEDLQQLRKLSRHKMTRALRDVLGQHANCSRYATDCAAGQVANLGAAYLMRAFGEYVGANELHPTDGAFGWRESDARDDLVKAAAFILAEIERLDRAEAKARTERLETEAVQGET